MNPLSLQPQLQRSFSRSRPGIVLIGVVLATYLMVPMLIVLPASFTAGQFLEVPPQGLSLRWYEDVFADPKWGRALLRSLQVSGMAAVVATLVATLAVIGISRQGKTVAWLRPIFFLPMVLPIIVFALGLGRASAALDAPASLVPLVIGQSVLGVPIAFIAISGGMSNIDPGLVRAAQSMGSSWWRTVWKIELPLLRRSILTALLLAFAFSFDEVVLALFLAPPGQSTLPALLYVEATQRVSPLLASASGLIIALTVVVTVAALVISRIKRRPASTAARSFPETKVDQ